MATFYQTDVVKNKRPARIEGGPCVVQMRAVFPVTADPVQYDKIEMLVLPADHVIVDAAIDASDLDGATSLAYDVGYMSGTPGHASLSRTVGAQLFSAATTGQSAGMVKPTTLRTAISMMPASYDRSIGIYITTAPGTPVKSSTTHTTNRGLWQASTAYSELDYITLPNGLRAFVNTGGAGTSGTTFPGELFSAAVKAGTVTDGGVTWTIVDPYIALSIWYRAAPYGV